MNIKEIEISKWRDFKKIRAIKGRCIIYKGQANADWPISSSLEKSLIHGHLYNPL